MKLIRTILNWIKPPYIEVRLKRYKDMRYATLGDYYKKNGYRKFDIADTGTDIYNKLILIHELIEETCCEFEQISDKSIDTFDMMFEAEREKGMHGHFEEPGDDLRAPYHRHHHLAYYVEKLIAEHLKVSFTDYEKTLNKIL